MYRGGLRGAHPAGRGENAGVPVVGTSPEAIDLAEALPPGEYEVRAAFGPVSAGSESSQGAMPPRPFIQPAPVRFRILAR